MAADQSRAGNPIFMKDIRQLKLKPRVWSSKSAGRFDFVVLKFRLFESALVACESSPWPRRIFTNAFSAI